MFIEIIAKIGRKLPESGRKLPKMGVFCGKMFLLHYCSLRGWEKSCIFADLILLVEEKMKNGFMKMVLLDSSTDELLVRVI